MICASSGTGVFVPVRVFDMHGIRPNRAVEGKGSIDPREAMEVQRRYAIEITTNPAIKGLVRRVGLTGMSSSPFSWSILGCLTLLVDVDIIECGVLRER